MNIILLDNVLISINVTCFSSREEGGSWPQQTRPPQRQHHVSRPGALPGAEDDHSQRLRPQVSVSFTKTTQKRKFILQGLKMKHNLVSRYMFSEFFTYNKLLAYIVFKTYTQSIQKVSVKAESTKTTYVKMYMIT